MIDVIPFAIFGSIETYFIVKVLTEIHQLVLHSSIKSDWGFIGRYIFVSPSAHRIHHSIKREHYGKNFGNTFIFWDRLFKTYEPKTIVEKLGVEKVEISTYGLRYGTVQVEEIDHGYLVK